MFDLQIEMQRDFFIQQQEKGERQFEIQTKLMDKQISQRKETSVKLSKPHIASLNRNRLLWIEFWDFFESAVHKNERLSTIDKFNYLKENVTGEARIAIAGLTLSNENYQVAIKILSERFGDKKRNNLSPL
jgi:hypothetical protein